MVGLLYVIAALVFWFGLNPDSAGKWFFKAQKAYLELKEKQQHDK